MRKITVSNQWEKAAEQEIECSKGRAKTITWGIVRNRSMTFSTSGGSKFPRDILNTYLKSPFH